VTDSLLLDARTQPGYAGAPLIELDGGAAGPGNGFTLDVGSDILGFVINGFRQGAAISVPPVEFFGSRSTAIVDSYIGTDLSGTTPRPNRIGVELLGSSNSVGPTPFIEDASGPFGGNVISGNLDYGVFIGGVSRFNGILGNLIGTDAAGSARIGNGISGVEIRGSDANGIAGDPSSGIPPNVISGNGVGVHVDGVGAHAFFYGNYIGTDATGMNPLGNLGAGIVTTNGALVQVGHPSEGTGNVIAGNGGDGIRLERTSGSELFNNRIGTDRTGSLPLGNGGAGIAVVASDHVTINGPYNNFPSVIGANAVGIDIVDSSDTVVGATFIGTDPSGTKPLGNDGAGVRIAGSRNTIGAGNLFTGADSFSTTIAFSGGPGVLVQAGSANPILANAIFANTGLGIDLSPFGVNPSDPGDTDTGPNDSQNPPKLTSAVRRPEVTVVRGVLHSRPNTKFLIELFTDTGCHPSGSGEGKRFVTDVNVTTNAGGSRSFSTSFPSFDVGNVMTATATDPAGSTSEFSVCESVSG
jgi:hypothetical protein